MMALFYCHFFFVSSSLGNIRRNIFKNSRIWDTLYLGVEAGYIQPHDSEYKGTRTGSDWHGEQSKITYSGRDFMLLGNGYLPIGNSFNFIGQAGVAYVSQGVDYTDGAIPMNTGKFVEPDQGKTTYHAFRPAVGVGASYYFTKSFSADFVANYIFGKGNFKSDKSAIANVVYSGLGLTYHFA